MKGFKITIEMSLRGKQIGDNYGAKAEDEKCGFLKRFGTLQYILTVVVQFTFGAVPLPGRKFIICNIISLLRVL